MVTINQGAIFLFSFSLISSNVHLDKGRMHHYLPPPSGMAGLNVFDQAVIKSG